MAEFNWTVDDIKRAQRDFSNNFMRLDCIKTESYDVAIDCMTECIEKKAVDVQAVRRGKWEGLVSRHSGLHYEVGARCSYCNEYTVTVCRRKAMPFAFCPHCTADMRGDVE